MAANCKMQDESRITTSWKEVYSHDIKFIVIIICLQVFQVTKAPPSARVELKEVPQALDWKFLDNQPPINDQTRRHHVFLEQVNIYVYTVQQSSYISSAIGTSSWTGRNKACICL